MNPEIFSEWLRRQGHTVIKTPNTYWHEIGPRVYQAFPYHRLIEPTEEELVGLLRKYRGIALRYSTSINKPPGAISYHAIYDRPSYTLENLGQWARRNVRIGLKNFRVEEISFEQLAEEGWALEVDTANRQGRRLNMRFDGWKRRALAASGLPGFKAWGAIVDNRLAASLLAFQVEDWYEILYQQCHRDYLSRRVNNALVFVATQTMLHQPGIRSIFYTQQSLDAPPSIDEFKFRMGYFFKPVRQRVLFHPSLTLFTNRLTQTVLVGLLRMFSGNYTLAKAEGLLRFYLEGKRSCKEQNWPKFLADRRIKILKALTCCEENHQGACWTRGSNEN